MIDAILNLERDILRLFFSILDKKCSRIHILISVLFADRIFDFLYSFRSVRERFEWSCFPLLKVNCIQCGGCCHNTNPLLSPPRSKGPYKVYTTEIFNQQYSSMFGEGALVELLFDFEKHNEKIDADKPH